ncbi:Bacterioferritin-associated ferredoxin [Pseudidiomarina piscicola]|uniref:Bacterioferritin-associated ferredoxin n=1 Tax=Pseudidiomarina piscicola TaxID=2614830 RepID=A0A6S6WJ10_9GAMM|nr:bacterioferritin-associated ferredoxin [Pseudidiomarina piscicola]CAB0149486.1 Bacterioferritin-associated ferredoxin [Pseudidiomarina piscicola]VZT38930.1 Bacterioferritin-associated ferredoxin [Pseudomonas aeruginosa]
MYVCLCKGVTDKTIRRAVHDEGISSMRELRQNYGVASQCGCCKSCAKEVLTEAVKERNTRFLEEALLPTTVCYT